MEVPQKYELKFHVYDGNEIKVEQFLTQYEKIRVNKRREGTVGSKVLSYFFEGLIAITTGDKSYWENNNQDAYAKYSDASRMFNRFKNSRNANARLDKLAERMISRSEGLVKLADTQAASKSDVKISFLNEALEHFNKEVAMANEMNDQMSAYAAFARASFTESQILLNQALQGQKTDSDNSKRSLMRARGSLKQAAYIDPRFYSSLENIETALDNLTRLRLLDRAEANADIASENSEKGNYQEAKVYFQKAMFFHKRASSLASDTGSRRKLLSSATIYEATTYEAEGNHLFRVENDTVSAAGKFEDAAKFVEKAIALMGHFGSKSLLDSFKCQRDYYRAMSLQSRAITAFDEEQFEEAKTKFDEGITLFENAIKLGKEGDNQVIVNMGNEAIADIRGYLSMVEAMI